MLVLQGAQGVVKSTAIEALSPNPDWYSDEFDANSKDGKLALRGV
jgi:predicted P-loop ATPase